MKKFLTLLMALTLVCTFAVAFASCGEENTGADSEAIDTTEAQNTENSEAEDIDTTETPNTEEGGGSTEETGDNKTDDEEPKDTGTTPDKPSEPDLDENEDFWSKNY